MCYVDTVIRQIMSIYIAHSRRKTSNALCSSVHVGPRIWAGVHAHRSVFMPPPIGKGAVSVAFVRPSVRRSVAYIANNSRTQRPNVPKFGKKVPHLRWDLHTSFKVKRSKIRVTKPINADTHRAPYLPNCKAYELQTWCVDGGRRPASDTGAMISEVKEGQGHKVT